MEGKTDSDSDVEERSAMERPTLIKQLQTILSDYPDDGQIIKEIIQNAEDAGAKEMKMLFSGRKIIDIDSAEFPYNKFFKSPAVCFYNNETFQEKDWRGIKMIYNSVKEEDPMKVGRFGLGFKSVFHITDFPCIISGDQLLLISPQEERDKDVCITIKLQKLKRSKKLRIKEVMDSLDGTFGFSKGALESGYFDGTIFWFSLRQTPSLLSDTVYNRDKILDLFRSFQTDSTDALLFLQNLSTVELFCRDSGSEFDLDSGNTAFFSVTLVDQDSKVQKERKDFVTKIKSFDQTIPNEDIVSVTTLHFKIESKTSRMENCTTEERHFLVVNMYNGGQMTPKLAKLMNDKTLHYSPRVGIGVPIRPSGNCICKGHVFCFLPLPQEKKSLSGLPVHVNGSFALSQNRRQLKWATADQDELEMHRGKPIEWNECLVTEMLPKAYLRLIQEMVLISKASGDAPDDIHAVYNCIPNEEQVDNRWKPLSDEVLRLLLDQEIVCLEATIHKRTPWVNPRKPMYIMFHGQTVQNKLQSCVKKLLSFYSDIKATCVPEYVWAAFKKRFEPNDINPAVLSKILHSDSQYTFCVSPEEKRCLVEYLLLNDEFDLLNNLALLPLANKTFIRFTHSGSVPVYLVKQAELQLFPGMESKFVATDLSPNQTSLINRICSAGRYQICPLQADVVTSLLAETLKHHFSADGTAPIVVKGPSAKVWCDWLTQVWQYIQTVGYQSLHKYSKLNLIPLLVSGSWENTEEFHLHKLTDNFILKTSRGMDPLPGGVARVLGHLPVTVLPSLPKWMNVDHLSSVLYPSPTNVLQLFCKADEALGSTFIEKFNSACTREEACSLIDYLGNSKITFNSRKVLCKLKLFRQGMEIGKYDDAMVSAAINSKLAGVDEFPVRFNEKLLLPHSGSEMSLALALGAREMTESQLILATLISMKGRSYTDQEKYTFMFWLFSNLGRFQNPSSILSQARTMAFVRTTYGRIAKAEELFDPSDRSLQAIFQNEAVFPADAFCSDACLFGLRKLGLKQKENITADDLMKTANHLHGLCTITADVVRTRNKAIAFLEILDELQTKKNILLSKVKSKQFGNQLASTKCIPHLQRRPNNYPKTLTWAGCTSTLSSPNDIKSIRYAGIVGSVMRLIDCSSLVSLSRFYKWDESPGTTCIVKQMEDIARSYSQNMKPFVLPFITEIYHAFSERKHDANTISMLQKVFAGVGVWWGDGFCKPEHIVLKERRDDISLKPYIYQMPTEHQSLHLFFCQMRCNMEQSVDVLLSVQQMIREKYDCSSFDKSEEKKDLDLVILILRRLFDQKEKLSDKDVLFPIHTGSNTSTLRLRPASQCTYCDAQWLRDVTEGNEEEEGITYVHEQISGTIAEALGVKSLRQQLMSDAEGLEEWGQEEPLTRRIRNLLEEGYVDGLSVPKEIIQNADDAGATEVCFMYDERENQEARTQLLDVGMAECQGSALWAYNNAKFTDSDLKSIISFSGATKKNDTSKIGKFGLGFNAVYNLTDVPSFISGHNMVIFDPHKTYLGKARPGKSPGIKIDLQRMKNMRMMKRLNNQFRPFHNVFGCDLTAGNKEVHFDGTLFRFPLRTKTQAVCSDISNTHYSRKETVKLLQQFLEFSGSLLLFTQNVLKLRILHLPMGETDPAKAQTLWTISKCVSVVKRNRQCEAVMSQETTILNAASQIKQRAQNQKTPLHLVQRVTITMKRHNTWKLLNVEEGSHEARFLIAWATGTRKAYKLSREIKYKGALPLASVAALVSEDNGVLFVRNIKQSPSGFYQSGHRYCFLPIPGPTSLSVHVNGCFAVTSDRRNLKASTEDDKYSNDWNAALLGDSVVNAFVLLLETVGELNVSVGYAYHQLWPIDDMRELPSLQRNFYKQLQKSDAKVFSNDQQWSSLSKCLVLDGDIRNEETYGQVAKACLIRFNPCKGTTVVDIPKQILDKFRQVSSFIDSRIISSSDFFTEVFFPHIDDVFWTLSEDKTQCRNKLVIKALESGDTKTLQIVKKMKCIPTGASGSLRIPAEVVNPNGPIAALFSERDGRFPSTAQGFALSPTILRTLETLGMMSATMPSCLLRERALSILGLAARCAKCAKDRCAKLLGYLTSTYDQTAPHLEEIRNIKFLPVLQKPDNWKASWKADNCKTPRMKLTLTVCSNHQTVTFTEAEQIRFEEPGVLHFESRKELIGCVDLVLDETITAGFSYLNQVKVESVLTQLGVKGFDIDALASHLVVKQLLQISLDHTQAKLPTQWLQTTCDKIYSYLDGVCKRNKASALEELQEIRRAPVIAIGADLIQPCQVACKLKHDCCPDLYGLDKATLKEYDVFLSCIGIPTEFNVDDLITVLDRKKLTWENKPLPDDELQLVCRELQVLADILKSEQRTGNDLCIYLPDACRVLRKNTELCIDDCEYVKDSKFMKFAHRDISVEVAETVGVKSKRRQKVLNHSKGIPFGQKEKLTSRLKRILEGYPCDVSILKEILQNADDAKATEVHFVKDYKTHGSDKIFDSQYEPLQGPALCVFNNSSFNENDMIGIQSLGVGNKGDDPTKTGQYGVGFNAVYHLTDVPSFISKGPEITTNAEAFCFLDPLCRYIQEANSNDPGLRITDIQSIRESFPDVMKPYHEQVFFKSNKGTLFRFPLRTAEMAKHSDISKEVITTDDLDHLLSMFQGEMLEAMLFLKNITKVTISNITSGKLVEEFSITASITNSDKKKRELFCQGVEERAKYLKPDPDATLSHKMLEVEYTLTLTGSHQSQQLWYVAQRFGCSELAELPCVIRDAYKNEQLGLLPLGGVALRLPSNQQNSVDRSSTIGVTQRNDGKAFCFLPLPIKTGLPVHINGHFALDHEARRNIWTDDKEGYKARWNNFLLEQVISRAYIGGLQFLKHRFIREIDVSQTRISEVKRILNEDFHAFFPNHSMGRDDTWKFLVKQTYRTMKDTEAHLFPVIREEISLQHDDRNTKPAPKEFMVEWVPLEEEGSFFPAFFDDLHGQITEIHKTPHGLLDYFNSNLKHHLQQKYSQQYSPVMMLVWELTNSLRSLGMKIINTPMSIHKSMIEAEVETCQITPETVMRFLHSHKKTNKGTCNLRIDVPVSQTAFHSCLAVHSLLYYCGFSSGFFAFLDGLPLLVTNDEVLRGFSKARKVFASSFCSLFSGSTELFVHHSLVSFFSFYEENAEEESVFGRLEMQSVINLLPLTLQSAKYKLRDKMLEWNPESNRVPSRHWISAFWKCVFRIFKRFEKAHENSTQQSQKEKHTNSSTDQTNNKAAKLKELLQGLSEWCLVPACISTPTNVKCETELLKDVPKQTMTSFHLTPVALSWTLFEEGAFCEISTDMRSAFGQMCIPVLHGWILDEGDMPLMRNLVTKSRNPKDVLECLYFHIDRIQNRHSLSVSDCQTVLKYFSDKLGDLRKCCNEIDLSQKLRALPLHVTINGLRVPIDEKKKVVVLPDCVPKDGMVAWGFSTGTTLLTFNSQICEIHKFLGCTTEKEIHFYTKHILPAFHSIPCGNQQDHIGFIRGTLLKKAYYDDYDEDQKTLIEKMKNLDFIHINGQTKRACDFYSPHEVVFKTMLEETKFPPEPYCSSLWMNFMADMGMKTDVTVSLFVQFAQHIEESGRYGYNEDIEKKSKVLLDHLFSRDNVLKEDILNRISRIKFICPYIVSDFERQICDQIAGGKLLISFSGSTSALLHQLTWSQRTMIPEDADPEIQARFNAKKWNALLGIQNPPQLEQVADHMKRVCDSLEILLHAGNNDFDYSSIESLMVTLYEYMKHHGTSSKSIATKLKHTSTVYLPNRRKLVPAYQVVLELKEEDEIPTYLYKFPIAFGQYWYFFEFLGSAKAVVPDHFAMVLQKLYNDTKGNVIHVMELQMVKKALGSIIGSSMKDKQDAGKDISSLYLPIVCNGDDSRLVAAKEVVVVDSLYHWERLGQHHTLQLFIGFEKLGIRVGDLKKEIELLPENWRPKLLSDVVTEKLNCTLGESLESVEADQLRDFFAGPELLEGLLRLFISERVDVSDEIITDVSANLRGTRFFQVEEIHTCLYINDEIVEGTKEQKECFSQEIKSSDYEATAVKWQLYFQCSASSAGKQWYRPLMFNLVNIVNSCTRYCIVTNQIHLMTIISCLDCPTNIQKELDRYKVPAYNLASSLAFQSAFPPAGKFVPERFIPFLIPASYFDVGEYVALELTDADDVDVDYDENEFENPTFIYSTIEKQLPTVDILPDFLQKYEADVGGGRHETLYVSQMYKFHRKTDEDTADVENDIGLSRKRETFTTMRKILKQAYKLPSLEKKLVVKRLLLKWHPLKNALNRELA